MTLDQALKHKNVQAFLKAIRLGEGTLNDDGYRTIVGGELFDSFADHPRKLVYIKRYDVWSSAAGAYQFIAGTWDEMRTKYRLLDFTPASQDRAAVGLLIRRKALDDVIAGRIEQAIEKCRLEWASLPGSPYGQRTESLQAVLDVYETWGGLLQPNPPLPAPPKGALSTPQVTHQVTPQEAPMAPFIAAALPALVQTIPELIRSFGDGKVTERNAAAAEAVLQVVQTATGTPNAQAAVEAVQSDPAARIAATEALANDHWFDTTEAGGGGIAGAREFNVEFADGKPLRMPALWVSFALLVPFYAAVFAVLFMEGWSAEIRIQVVTAVLATVGVVSAFWLGSSFATNRRER